jgi:hydroxymethylbilane synthase
VSAKYKSLAELPEGAVIGSAALRRQAQLLNRYPTLKIVNFRGNVQSRIRKLQEGVVRAPPFMPVTATRLTRVCHVSLQMYCSEDSKM